MQTQKFAKMAIGENLKTTFYQQLNSTKFEKIDTYEGRGCTNADCDK